MIVKVVVEGSVPTRRCEYIDFHFLGFEDEGVEIRHLKCTFVKNQAVSKDQNVHGKT